MDGSPQGNLGSVQPRVWLWFHRQLVCRAHPPPPSPMSVTAAASGLRPSSATTAVFRLDLLMGER